MGLEKDELKTTYSLNSEGKLVITAVREITIDGKLTRTTPEVHVGHQPYEGMKFNRALQYDISSREFSTRLEQMSEHQAELIKMVKEAENDPVALSDLIDGFVSDIQVKMGTLENKIDEYLKNLSAINSRTAIEARINYFTQKAVTDQQKLSILQEQLFNLDK